MDANRSPSGGAHDASSMSARAPSSALAPSGEADSPKSPSGGDGLQQTGEPSSRKPQAWEPTLIWANLSPSGGVKTPSAPQQTGEPSFRSAQA